MLKFVNNFNLFLIFLNIEINVSRITIFCFLNVKAGVFLHLVEPGAETFIIQLLFPLFVSLYCSYVINLFCCFSRTIEIKFSAHPVFNHFFRNFRDSSRLLCRVPVIRERNGLEPQLRAYRKGVHGAVLQYVRQPCHQVLTAYFRGGGGIDPWGMFSRITCTD